MPECIFFFFFLLLILNELSEKCLWGFSPTGVLVPIAVLCTAGRNDGTFLHVVPEEISRPFNSTSNRKG